MFIPPYLRAISNKAHKGKADAGNIRIKNCAKNCAAGVSFFTFAA